MTKIYAILNREEQTFFTFGPKVAWSTVGAAKNAYNLHWGSKGRIVGKAHKFDEQDRYEIVELAESYFRLKDLED